METKKKRHVLSVKSSSDKVRQCDLQEVCTLHDTKPTEEAAEMGRHRNK